MNDRNKTKEQLIDELTGLRRRVAKIEEVDAIRKQAEKKVEESDKKYHILFENATDAIYIIDQDTEKIIDCNKKASELSGYSVRELKTMTIAELYPSEEQDVVSKIFRKVTERGSLSDISGISQRRKDDKLVPVEINAATIELDGKRYSLGIIRDITKRVKAEENLRYEKNKLTGIFDAMEDGVYIANQQYVIEYINPTLKKQFGAIKGRKCYEYFHEREKICPWCKNKDVSSGKTIRWEWYSPTSQRTYDLIDTPLRNPDGSISKLEIFRDITDRKRAEEEVKESEKKYRLLINNFANPITVYDLNGVILLINNIGAKNLGGKPEDFVGKSLYDLVPGMADNIESRNQQIATSKNGAEFEDPVSLPSGEERWFRSNLQPVRDKDGNIYAIQTISYDITDHKKMEKQLYTASTTDNLTGLFNRHGFFNLSLQEIKRADRDKRGFSLLSLEIDNFRKITEKYGHKAGYQILEDASQILKATFRESDIISRTGGDEFSVLLVAPPDPQIEKIIITHIEDNLGTYNKQSNRGYEMSFSLGIAHYDPYHPCSFDELLTQTNALMSKNKHQKLTISKGARTEKRQYERFSNGHRLKGSFDIAGEVFIKNISLGGICLRTSHELPLDTSYKIKLMDLQNKSINLIGNVVWSSTVKTKTRKEIDLPAFESGLKYTNVNNGLKKSLQEIIPLFDDR